MAGGRQEKLYGKPTTEKVLFMARRALGDMEGSTGASTRETSVIPKTSRGPSACGGLDEERQILGMEGDITYSPAKGGGCLAGKKSRANTTYKKNKDDTQART